MAPEHELFPQPRPSVTTAGGTPLTCAICHKPIVEGDDFGGVSVVAGEGKRTTKDAHSECIERIFNG